MGQVLDLENLLKELKQKRGQRKVVFTNGCFDILHVGHVTYLKQACALGDILIVGLNSDKSVKGLKGETRPIQCQEDRAIILSSLSSVHYVVLFDEETPENLIKSVRPDILVKGGDWSVDKIVGSEFVQSIGGTVLSIPYIEGRSSSNLIDKLKSL